MTELQIKIANESLKYIHKRSNRVKESDLLERLDEVLFASP